MKKRANVALIVETSGAYGRQILRGVSRYLHAHSQWSVFLDERERMAPPPQWLLDWDGDGILCRSTTPDLARALRERALPVVDCNERHGFLGLPYIASDMNAIGVMATRHLLERGFGRIAFCGFEGEAWSKARLQGVQNALGENASGAQLCSVFESSSDSRARDWMQERALLCDWIQTLTFPVGIVACNDVRGQHVIDACRMLGVAVPEQVAVVGVDNSVMLCELCDPPLSSVAPAAERIGFEAAALLDRLMNENLKSEAPPAQIYLPPREVITRQSSDVWAVDDPAIARALHFIREHACEAISVEEVANYVRMSRSTLERNFRRLINGSPQQEIRRVRLQRVQNLLRETDLPLANIAELAGYQHCEYMMVQFKKTFGQTPSQWRIAQATARGHSNQYDNFVPKNLS